MAVLATDNFNRADSASLGASWTTPTGDLAWRITSNAATYNTVSGADTAGVYNAITWPADQYSQVKATAGTGGGGVGVGPTCRAASAAQTRYRLVACGAATSNIELSKEVAGTFTSIWFRTSSFANGNLVRLEAQGTTLRAYNAGVQVGASSTDSSIASGNAGFLYSAIDASISADDWEGGDFTTSGVMPRGLFVRQAVRRASSY
jgi:hypothetical protein